MKNVERFKKRVCVPITVRDGSEDYKIFNNKTVDVEINDTEN